MSANVKPKRGIEPAFNDVCDVTPRRALENAISEPETINEIYNTIFGDNAPSSRSQYSDFGYSVAVDS